MSRIRKLGVFFGVIFMAMILGTEQHSGGGPTSQCLTMKPLHTEPQTGHPPDVAITLSPACYTVGQPIDITLASSVPFKGIFLQIRHEERNVKASGTFSNLDEQKFRLIDCPPRRQNTITHRSNSPVSTLNFKWTASTAQGNLDLVYSLVENFNKYWVKEKVKIPICANE